MNSLSNKNSNSLVSELKHLTLSIDRGVTDDLRQKLVKITDSLGYQWQQDKVLSTLIKMTRALSDYAAKGVNREIISLLNSIVSKIDYLSSPTNANLPMAKRQAILSEEIAKYNKLKQQIKSSQKDISEDISNSSVIAELKSIILSLDWEITDEIINRLEKEVNKLQSHWQNSKIHLSFLQMFKGIGSYVMSKGSNTHPDAISLLNSIYKNFEQIVLNPNMSVANQKDILLGEMKKFNDLKQLISSAKVSKPRSDLNVSIPAASPQPPTPQRYNTPSAGVSLMDDLIGTKNSSNLSPVDDLIEEIHMLQDSGDRTHSIDKSSHGSSSANTNPEIKEIIPNRLKKEPIPEIQKRLDAFFDEDEPLSELAFADSGDTVVPYKGNATSDYVKPLQTTKQQEQNREPEPDLNDDSDFDIQDISFDNEDSAESNVESNDIVVPYDLENEFFEETIEPSKKTSNITTKNIEYKEVENNYTESDDDTPETIKLLEELKSTVGKSIFHGGSKEIKEINLKIESLEQIWSEKPQKLILLKMVKSLAGYFDLLATASEEQTLELMLYIVESMEDHVDKSDHISGGKITSNKNAAKNNSIIDVFSRYIDFQNSIIINKPPSLLSKENSSQHPSNFSTDNKVQTLADKEILYDDRPSEDSLDIEKKLTEPKGLWGKIKKWLGL